MQSEILLHVFYEMEFGGDLRRRFYT